MEDDVFDEDDLYPWQVDDFYDDEDDYDIIDDLMDDGYDIYFDGDD